MKNLKIGAKIFLGFTIVIVLMIIITGTAAILGLTTIQNLGNIDADSILQTKGTELTNAFYTARLDVKIISYVINDEAYNEAVKSLSECDDIINDMREHISRNPILEEFRPQLEEVERQLGTYGRNVMLLQESNTALGGIEESIDKLGATLTGLSDALDGSHITALYDSASREMEPTGRIAQLDNLTDGAMISQGIWNMRKNADVMSRIGLNYAGFESDLQWIDNTIALANESKSLSSQIAELRMQLPMFKVLIEEFRDEMSHNVILASDCAVGGSMLLNDLNNMMTAIDGAMANQVEVTTNTAGVYLIVAMAVSIAAIIIAAVVALLISRSITKPVKMMVSVADAIAVGNMSVDVEYTSKDEIGKLAASFKHMVDAVSEQVATVASIADGDLSVEVKSRGEDDKMGAALVKMVDNLNNMFGEINASSEQVTSGARQISDGAQMLAQGATEQAAAVEELSSSISEVAEKTKGNAQMADQMANLAAMIRQNAENGSVQMDQMMQAVREINEASHNISKVIKVIDDIAFQTNILALNAAVEAARAGQHGKGFAVVAEEVRNLAAKSAEAAKDTEGLIADSMEKAALGSQIAEETSASLTEIVKGVNDTGYIVDEIAKSSGEQSAAIMQINIGVDQVAQVVQQNSATAEQSAAASEEMSGQSDMLAQLISQFKLRDGVAIRHSLPQSERPPRKQFAIPDEMEYAMEGGFGKY